MCDSTATLLSLPFELKLAIFSYLDVNSIFTLSSLSHEFNSVAMCEEFYQFAIEKDCILLKHSNSARSEFLKYLEHYLSHVSWKLLYKQLVVLPYLERKFISLLDFGLIWKQEEEYVVPYLPRLIRLETVLWAVTSKHVAASNTVQELEDTIIMGHHCFATLSQFFVLLVVKYCVPIFNLEKPIVEHEAAAELARTRVCQILAKWIQKNKHDILLNRSLCTLIRQFINYTLTPHHKQIAQHVLQTISTEMVQQAVDHVNETCAGPPATSTVDLSSLSLSPKKTSPTASPASSPASSPNFPLPTITTTSTADVNGSAERSNGNHSNNSSPSSSPNVNRTKTTYDNGDNNNNNARNGETAITINTKFAVDEDEVADYEKRNINEFNNSNHSPFGSAGMARYHPLFSVSRETFNLNILECDIDALALEIAWFDWELYYRIKVSEIMDKSWRHSNKFQFSPNIVASIKWFNHVSFWVATEVLNFPKVKLRAQALSNFIQLALRCYDLRDFHSVFSILAGLNMACIHRLRSTWECVPKKLNDNFTRLSSFITGVNGDFLAYKNTLKNSPLPAVPYLGCLLNDITFVLDTSENPKFPTIYMHKIVVMSKIVNEVVRFQQVPYTLTKNQYLNQLRNVKVLDASELYRKSLEVEPKLPLRTASPSLFGTAFGNNA